ncbi:molecular chaperone DnaJ [Devosia pacifica]|uniref:Molecular chaperone DnaJ n=1 Tax=Devosia pacifica TaxID=1335967 RepID=A0A918S7U4_9HYPH|nr:DnaJ domain-containing protein [Devosia pacifica]GHA26652.1 molecular chaperone DnaJ [Devosia pacifica]
MKIDSKLFDNVRIRSRKGATSEKPEVAAAPECAWEGCEKPGLYKAPKGHKAEGQYHNFCLEHVRHYNTAYNFFSDMSDEELEETLTKPPRAESRSSFGTGQPGARNSQTARTAGMRQNERYGDPFGVFARYRYRQGKQTPAGERSQKPIHEPDRRALEALGFTGRATSDEIKSAYKGLVKIHHPDANGGDKSSEERLRTIIAAYTHLKKAGFLAG